MGNYYETFYPPFFMDRRYAYNAIAINPNGWDRDDIDIVADFMERLHGIEPLDTSLVKAESHHQIIMLQGEVANNDVIKFLGRIADNVLMVHSKEEFDRWAKTAYTPPSVETTLAQAGEQVFAVAKYLYNYTATIFAVEFAPQFSGNSKCTGIVRTI